MPITLNKKKDFKKTNEVDSSKLKAQDETIQITRKEWDAMQESLAQLQTFMNDLVEGNLEIEIVDDGKKDSEEDKLEETEAPKDDKEAEEVEEIELETPPAGDKNSKETKPETKEEVKEEKTDDAEIEEVMKDPVKRKAVLEYLKATDSVHPIKDLSLSKLRKRVSTIVNKEHFEVAKKGTKSMSPSEVVTEIMNLIKNEKKAGKEISVDNLGRIANKFLNSLDLQNKEKAKDSKTMKRKTIKKSVDSKIPDFTSRFEDKKSRVKAVDNNKKDLSKDFQNRFN